MEKKDFKKLTKKEEKGMGKLFLCAAMPNLLYRTLALKRDNEIVWDVDGDEASREIYYGLNDFVPWQGNKDYEKLKDGEKELGLLMERFFYPNDFDDAFHDFCLDGRYLKYIEKEEILKQIKFVVKIFRKEKYLREKEDDYDEDEDEDGEFGGLNDDLYGFYTKNEERFRKHYCKDLTPSTKKEEKRREEMSKKEKEFKALGDFVIWQYVLYDAIGRSYRNEAEIDPDEILFDMVYKIGELILERLKENEEGMKRHEKPFTSGPKIIESAYLYIDNNDEKEKGMNIKRRLVTLLLEDKILTRDKNKMFRQLQQIINDTLRNKENQNKGSKLLNPILKNIHNIGITNDDLKAARLKLEEAESDERDLKRKLAHTLREIRILKTFILNRENVKIKSEENIKNIFKNEGEGKGT